MTAVRGACRGDDDAGARRLTARGFGGLAGGLPLAPVAGPEGGDPGVVLVWEACELINRGERGTRTGIHAHANTYKHVYET